MNNKKNLSIKDIASLANVSIATVSRVINNSGRYSKETGEKIQKIIAEYGYTANMAAKSLRSAKSKTIGLIVPSIDNEWFSNLVLEIEKNLFQKNYSVFICNSSQDQEKEISYFRSLDSKLVDGIICISGIEVIPSDVVKRDIPIVCIDRKPKNSSQIYYVESNHYEGGFLATEELIKKGCKNIAIISRNSSLSVNRQRYAGYLEALKKYHLKPQKELKIIIDKNTPNFEGAQQAVEELINRAVPFDGIFATNDWRAYGALSTLNKHNIKVPQDVKIVGFDDIFISKAAHPEISTIKQDIPGLAATTTNLLLSLIDNNPQGEDLLNHYIIPVSLVSRESTKNNL